MSAEPGEKVDPPREPPSGPREEWLMQLFELEYQNVVGYVRRRLPWDHADRRAAAEEIAKEYETLARLYSALRALPPPSMPTAEELRAEFRRWHGL
jgi:hypothetical protein